MRGGVGRLDMRGEVGRLNMRWDAKYEGKLGG